MSYHGWTTIVAAFRAVVFCLFIAVPVSYADGTDILEPTSAVLADGSGIIGAGVGLSVELSGDIEISVPEGAAVKQVLLYWDGADRFYSAAAPVSGVTTDTVLVSSFPVEGVYIGGRTFGSDVQQFTFRADITSLGLISPGLNTLTISGVNFGSGSIENGAGVLVVIDDGTPSELGILDGSDYAYAGCLEDFNCQVTVKRAFTFPAAETARNADLTMFFTSVAGEVSSNTDRPSTVRVWVGSAEPIEIVYELDGIAGEQWDTLEVEFEVPAGVDQVEVQAFSEDPNLTGKDPASFKWLAAALSVPSSDGGQGGGDAGNDNAGSDDAGNDNAADDSTSGTNPSDDSTGGISPASSSPDSGSTPAITTSSGTGGGGAFSAWDLLVLFAFAQLALVRSRQRRSRVA
jgi:hypothetical protein